MSSDLEWPGVTFTDADGNPIEVRQVGPLVSYHWMPGPPREGEPCRVYWGSHGCDLLRGHDGPHLCSCTFENDDSVNGQLLPHMDDSGPDEDGYESNGNVGRPPYYGADTEFYGEDALGSGGVPARSPEG